MTRGVYVFQQVRALSRRAEVSVVAPLPYIPPLARSPRYRAFARVPRQDVLDGVPVRYPRYIVIPRIMRFLHGYFVFLWTLPAHLRVAGRLRPDVVLSFFAYPYGFAAVLVARMLGRPVVVSCRGSDINHIARAPVRGRMIAWSLRRCRTVLVVSRALGEAVAALGVDRERIRVVPNGIDGERFAPGDRGAARESLGVPTGAKLVVCVSRLSREKGVDLLLEAAVRPGLEDVRFAVVGDGPERNALERRRDELGIQDRFQFAGLRPHEEVPVWMAAADLAVLSSRTEGHPNAVLEALACARPVVATRVGGVPDILSEDGLGVVVEPENPAALADGVKQALRRPWDPSRLTAFAHSRSWERVAEELETILEAAAGAGRARAREGRLMAQ